MTYPRCVGLFPFVLSLSGSGSQRASVMNKKSEENILAAEVLIHEGYYNSSIHCSYYALFQYMKYILNSRGLCSYAVQDQKTNAHGSHNNILEELKGHIKDAALSRKVRDSFRSLKKQRTIADYEIIPMVKVESQMCLNDVCDMIAQLNQYFTP